LLHARRTSARRVAKRQQRRVFITGCSGYLAQRLIEKLLQENTLEWIGGNDVRAPQRRERFTYFPIDIRSRELATILREHRVDTVVHLAWVFNPHHDPQQEYEIDVKGSENVLHAVLSARIRHLVYLSSTTSYGAHADNPEVLDEDAPRRGHPTFLYSKYKAVVDSMMLEFHRAHPSIGFFMVRAPIVLGPHTRNFVTAFTELPVVFGVRGCDPPMQFLHEDDMQRLLAWAVVNKPKGTYVVSGHGTVRYSEVARIMQRPYVTLPASVLHTLITLGWKLRILPFPASILDFIRYPWVCAMKQFPRRYRFPIHYSSREAVLAYARTRWPDKF
jgi:nucleoside-diphosphate-sugar epimerase